MVDWKIKAGISAAVIGAGVIALILFQKQIREATFTAGQTIGQAVTSPIQGFIEPFQKLFASFQQATNTFSIPSPSPTPQIYVPGVVVDPNTIPPPGSTPPPGTTAPPPNKNGNGTTPPGGYYPGISPYGGIPKNAPGTTETITQTAYVTPPNKYKVSQITINKSTTTSFTDFLNAITKQVNDFGIQTINAANQAWAQLNANPVPGVIVIPGFPVINVPFIPAFAETPKGNTSTTNKVTPNTKTSYGMGATSFNPVVTKVNWENLAKFYTPAKINVPKSQGGTLPPGFSQPNAYKPTPLPSGSLYAFLNNQSA